MEYFGTNLTEAGHYRWNIDNGWQRMNYRFGELSFHPENITNNLPKGSIVFYQGGGFTVIGIAGSCIDNRLGTESIFWVREIITSGEMIERIKSNHIAMQIINAMPFKVNFPVPAPEIQMPGDEEINDMAFCRDNTEDYSEVPVFVNAVKWFRNEVIKRNK